MKGFKMAFILVVGMIFGIATESAYNVTGKPADIKTVEKEVFVDRPVIVEKEILKEVIVKIKPVVTCVPKVVYAQ